MPRERTAIEEAAGKLVSAVQREWGAELGTSQAEIGEHTLGRAHELLQAAMRGDLKATLGGGSVSDFLGAIWVRRHPGVRPAIERLESLLGSGQHA